MNTHVKITSSEPADLSRRSFLVGSAAAGLALGYSAVPGLAVAALRHLLGDPCLLQGMIALGAETLDGGDFLADGIADRGLAGSYGFTVDVNGTGTAQAGAAAEFCAGHL